MSDTPFPRYPGGNDPDPSQRDRHEAAARSDSWHHAAVVLFAVASAAVLLYSLTILLIRMMPMPVLI